MKVMVADDERDICEAVSRILARAGHCCVAAYDGCSALTLFEEERPDLVILDVMMPEMNGFDVCRAIREADPRVPVLMLSAKSDIVDKGTGFAAGCDEYIAKPFDPRELAMRVEANLRRARIAQGDQTRFRNRAVVNVGEMEVRLKKGEVYVRGRKINLTPKEFRIVAFLANHVGEAFTAGSIIENVWDDDARIEPAALAVFVRKIRSKTEEDPSHPVYLQTVWRQGYRLGAPGEGASRLR